MVIHDLDGLGYPHVGKTSIICRGYYWLVVTGTMEFYDFPETVGNVIIPTDELISFRGVETTN